MTVTLEEAQANLPGIVAKAATGEEVFIATGSARPAVKLVAVTVNGSRLAQDAQVKSALTILNHEALVTPLSPEEWGELAKR